MSQSYRRNANPNQAHNKDGSDVKSTKHKQKLTKVNKSLADIEDVDEDELDEFFDADT